MNTAREELIAGFYEGNGLTTELYELGGNGDVSKIKMHYGYNPDDHKAADHQEQLEEVAQSTRIVTVNGRNFCISEANLDAPADNVMLHIATYSSDIPGNPGNADEFASQAKRYREVRQLYITPYGVGSTDPLTVAERRYGRTEGRFTFENEDGETEALPSIQDLAQALRQEELLVTRFGTDSAGGNYATALGLAMPEGQITHAFLSERPGLINLSAFAIAKGMLFDENMRNSKENRALGEQYDPMCLTDEMIDKAKQVFANAADAPNMKEVAQNKIGGFDAVMSLWTSLQALRRGPAGYKDPKAQDTNAFLRNQPDVQVTFGIAEHDPLYRSPEIARLAAERLLQRLVVPSGKGDVAAVIIPGMTHAYNTHFPGLYHAIKSNALDLD
jgi:hypothetical protein